MVNKEHEEQLIEMTSIVEKEEKKQEEKITKEFDEESKREETKVPAREGREERYAREEREKLEKWIPKTVLGREARSGKIKNIDEILNSGRKILEPEIVDILLPNLIVETLFIGQAKGKFGGGKRRAFRQTQKKTKEGNVLTFGVMAVVGDGKGHVGLGYGRAAETLPAKEKAIRKAKLNLFKIARGCSSYNCSCDDPHSLPIAVSGKCSSVRLNLIPAPQGTGLVVGDEMKKIMKAVGIKDVYSQTYGRMQTTINAAKACISALSKLGRIKL
jgi:small subunit ribosomal protein S5